MAWMRSVVLDAGDIALGNGRWMTWNTLLALLPALLAPLLFRHRHRWGALWWLGLGGFILLLPNAPYVVTDLVHLREDVAAAESDAAVYAGVLPLYIVFIGVGFGCYAFCLSEVGAWLRGTGRASWIGRVELGIHGLSAVGVLLGRVARLNSWDVAQPQGALERAIDTLSWRGSPVAIAVLFIVIWIGHAITRALTTALVDWLARQRAHFLGPSAT